MPSGRPCALAKRPRARENTGFTCSSLFPVQSPIISRIFSLPFLAPLSNRLPLDSVYFTKIPALHKLHFRCSRPHFSARSSNRAILRRLSKSRPISFHSSRDSGNLLLSQLQPELSVTLNDTYFGSFVRKVSGISVPGFAALLDAFFPPALLNIMTRHPSHGEPPTWASLPASSLCRPVHLTLQLSTGFPQSPLDTNSDFSVECTRIQWPALSAQP